MGLRIGIAGWHFQIKAELWAVALFPCPLKGRPRLHVMARDEVPGTSDEINILFGKIVIQEALFLDLFRINIPGTDEIGESIVG